MSNKEDKEKVRLPIVIFKDDEGFPVESEASQNENEEASDASDKENKKSNLVIPIEEYAGALSQDEIQKMKEQQIASFPDLFDQRGYDPDVESEQPSLRLAKPAKMLSTLIEADMRNKLKRKKEPEN